MDGFGDDGLLPLFSQPDPYASPVHSFNVFSNEQSRHASSSANARCQALDLNAQSDEWPHLTEYSGLLQSFGGGGSTRGGSRGGGGGGLPPLPSRGGRGGIHRTLRLRAGHDGGRGAPGSGRTVPTESRGASQQASAIPAGSHGASQQAFGRGRGVRCHDAVNTDNEDIQEVPPASQSKFDKANWSEPNNNILCQLLVEQIELGNYNKGTMTARGYKLIAEKYHLATNLLHERKQFANRIRQLKGMFNFIKELYTRSGLGRHENGWPNATEDWWEDETKGHHEWKKLKYGPPKYLPLLEQIFEGVVVDGSTSFVAGQDFMEAEEDFQEEPDVFEHPQESPMSSGSQKRASSTSTTSTTGTSPVKKSKSLVIKMIREFFSVSTKQAEQQNAFL